MYFIFKAISAPGISELFDRGIYYGQPAQFPPSPWKVLKFFPVFTDFLTVIWALKMYDKGGGGFLSMYSVPPPTPHTHPFWVFSQLLFTLELSYEITSELLQGPAILVLCRKKIFFFLL